MNLRPRQRQPFSGFTKAEVQKMEQFLNESKEQLLDVDFFKKLARIFNCSSNRAGKSPLKWTEIQSWFQKNQRSSLLTDPSFNAAEKLTFVPEDLTQKKKTKNQKMPEGFLVGKAKIESYDNDQHGLIAGEKNQDTFRLEFEARSSKDGAWYDVDTFLSHRFLGSGEIEVYVRYVGFGAEEDEWVNARNNIRERSVALEHSECQKVKVGDLVVCFRERQDQAKYYDARVIDIQRRLHDIRGCRCLFMITYDHDNTQERVPLRGLCCRPDMLARFESN